MIGTATRERMVGDYGISALTVLGILSLGTSYTGDEFSFVRVHPPFSQILVCLSGDGQVLVDNEWVQLEAGTAYVTPAGQVHAYHTLAGCRWNFGWVKYSGFASTDPVDSALGVRIVACDPRPLSHALLGLYSEHLAAEETAVMQLWANLVDKYVRKLLRSDVTSYRLQSVWDRVDRTLARPWTVMELASLAGTSEEHLRRLCRRYHQKSPMRLVTSMRMRRAATLLLSESLTVEAVADHVGYENAFAFSTAFRRFAGVSPSDYRRQAALDTGNSP